MAGPSCLKGLLVGTSAVSLITAFQPRHLKRDTSWLERGMANFKAGLSPQNSGNFTLATARLAPPATIAHG